jgi:hypothetical protein
MVVVVVAVMTNDSNLSGGPHLWLAVWLPHGCSLVAHKSPKRRIRTVVTSWWRSWILGFVSGATFCRK